LSVVGTGNGMATASQPTMAETKIIPKRAEG
jgi:hypothetical protein